MLKKLWYTLLWYSVLNRLEFKEGSFFIWEKLFYYQCSITNNDIIINHWWSIKIRWCYFNNVRIFVPSDFTNVSENITWCKILRYKDEEELKSLKQNRQ